MQSVEQTPGQNLLQHGLFVFETACFLAYSEKSRKGLKLPDWLPYFKKKLDDLLAVDLDVISKYLIYHDCGKAFCGPPKNGKKFPNHDYISAIVWDHVSNTDEYHGLDERDRQRVTYLIRQDMYLHTTNVTTLKEHMIQAGGSIEFTNNWHILLLAALAEIHANAEMFGGIDSDSFKIKWKRINKNGKFLCEHFLDYKN